MNDTADSGGEVVVIFGGRSEIGLELAVRLAPGNTVVLAARRADQLTDEVQAVRAAGAAAVHTCEFDADDLASHAALVSTIEAEHGPIGTAVLAFGLAVCSFACNPGLSALSLLSPNVRQCCAMICS